MLSQLRGVIRFGLRCTGRALSALTAIATLGGLSALAACGPIGGVDDRGIGGAGGQAPSASAGTSGAVVLPPEPAFKVVGYQPSWAGTFAGLQFDKLDYINYAFAIEGSDGSVSLPQPTRALNDLVSRGHAAGVRVLLSVGGWNEGNDRPFNDLSANAATRAAFATNLDSIVDQYQLDGIDVDWEFPEPAVSGQFTSLMQELGAKLKPKGKLLTIAGGADQYGGGGVTAEALAYIDFVNIMAYDGGQGEGHSPYALAQSSLQFWLSKGIPRSKAIVGVPFYSRPGYQTYAAIVAQNPAFANQDQVNDQFYNGIPTVQMKTALAMGSAGGIMAWDLSQDTRTPELSLLSAIYAKSHP